MIAVTGNAILPGSLCQPSVSSSSGTFWSVILRASKKGVAFLGFSVQWSSFSIMFICEKFCFSRLPKIGHIWNIVRSKNSCDLRIGATSDYLTCYLICSPVPFVEIKYVVDRAGFEIIECIVLHYFGFLYVCHRRVSQLFEFRAVPYDRSSKGILGLSHSRKATASRRFRRVSKITRSWAVCSFGLPSLAPNPLCFSELAVSLLLFIAF